jgi:hypothetical protein
MITKVRSDALASMQNGRNKSRRPIERIRKRQEWYRGSRGKWECGQAQDSLGIEVIAMGSAEEVGNKPWSLLR